MLTRIYGTAWATQERARRLSASARRSGEARPSPLGREMDLFHFQEEAPGAVFWHPKGWTLFQTLIAYMRRRQNDGGYHEVNAPQLLDRACGRRRATGEIRENMFRTRSDDTEDERIYALKPMNCPGHVQIFKHG
jgi:threonyl-tRNA synthetase